MTAYQSAPALDELLLDVATELELSDNDRAVAGRRYDRLQDHLTRPSSPLRDYIAHPDCQIYPQGSMSIGATILSGTNDDRFDVDAIVEFEVPAEWDDKKPLDLLEEAMQGFPGAKEIVRCTRCIQVRFPFMHLDVTILDPAAEPRPELAGEIFHSPDNQAASRVPANPYGFSQWFRDSLSPQPAHLAVQLQERRARFGSDRLVEEVEERAVAKAEQEALPRVIPPRLDGIEVVALKLMKRFVNLRYEKRTLKRPPSIYLTKLSVTAGYDGKGVTAHLEKFASRVKSAMEDAIAVGSGPDERNPTYDLDKLNDRWPKSQLDRQVLAQDMGVLLAELQAARTGSVTEVAEILERLFGEQVGKRAIKILQERYSGGGPKRYEHGTGTILGAAVAAPSIAHSSSPVRSHNFHTGVLERRE